MKRVLTALFTTYSFCSAQFPPATVNPPPLQTPPVQLPPVTTSASPPFPPATTGAAPAQSTFPVLNPPLFPPPVFPPQPNPIIPPAVVPPVGLTSSTTAAPIPTEPAGVANAATTTTSVPIPPVISTTAAPLSTTSAPIATNTVPAPVEPYVNPYCPASTVYGVIGTTPRNQAGNAVKACWASTDVATDFNGYLQCDYFGCCLCDAIMCGVTDPNLPCEYIKFGDRAATGVRNIIVDGNPMGSTELLHPNGNALVGAYVECSGLESCKAGVMYTRHVFDVSCSGDYACKDTHFVINEPAPRARIACDGKFSCMGATIEINVGREPPAGQMCSPTYTPEAIEMGEIRFLGQQSGQDATIIINNRGCDRLFIRDIECPDKTSCGNTRFMFYGDVRIRNCNPVNLGTIPPQLLACNLPTTTTTTSTTTSTTTTTTTSAPQPVTTAVVQPVQQQQQPSTTAQQQQPPPPQQTPRPRDPNLLWCGPTVDTCSGMVQTLETPSSGYKVECLTSDSCNMMELTINMRMNPASPNNYVQSIGGFFFHQPNTAKGSVFVINNFQNGFVPGSYGKLLKVDSIKCLVPGACTGLTIVAGPDVDILSGMDCAQPGACDGCQLVVQGIARPCDYKNIAAYSSTTSTTTTAPQPQPPVFNVPQFQTQTGPINPVNNVPNGPFASPFAPPPAPVV